MPHLLFTSDWHLGARMGTAGAAAPRFREQKLATAERIVERAEELAAAALFLLGDTFDGDRVGLPELERAAEILGKAPCPVFLLPGNHDWWHPGGALATFAQLAKPHPHLHVLRSPEEPLTLAELPGVTFYPAPVLEHAGIADPTAWIPARRAEDGLRIGLLHGGLDLAEWGGRIPQRVAELRDLELAVLGDWHKPFAGPDGRTRYPGSPEPGGFDEGHRGEILRVAIDTGGIELEREEIGALVFRRLELELESAATGGTALTPLSEAVADPGPFPERAALRLHLAGRLDPAELAELETLLDRVREAGWGHVEVDSRITPLGELVPEAFEEPALRAVAERVAASDASPAVRRRALAILQTRAEALR